MEERKWCVYLHTVHADCGHDKYYVGITGQNVNHRWNNGNGYCSYFGNAIKKYGWDNIDHTILCTNLSENEAKEKEIELINKYKSFDRYYGYNRTIGGDGTTGYKLSKETKKKISNATKGKNNPLYGKNHTEQSKAMMRKSAQNKHDGIKNGQHKIVYQYNFDGTYVKSWDYVSLVEYVLKINHGDISSCCNGKLSSAGGYMWKYFKKDKIDAYNTNEHKARKVYQYTKDNVYIREFESATIASNETGCNEHSIRRCCNKKYKTSGGFVWSYEKYS